MTDTPQPTSPLGPGPARARLIEAGLEVFGRHGFTAATTRMIAEQGKVNLAAIPYHFGGKEGLYLAVVEHIVATVNGQFEPWLQAVRKRLVGRTIERNEALELLETLLGVLIDFVVGSPEASRFSRIILREQMSPSSAFDRIYAGIMLPVQSAVVDLLDVISAGAVSPRVLGLRAFSLVGQIMAFRFARETVVRHLDITGYRPEETLEIRRIILEQTRAALSGLYPVRSND